MLAFGIKYSYRRPSKDNPNAPQPIPSTRDLMGLTDKEGREDKGLDESPLSTRNLEGLTDNGARGDEVPAEWMDLDEDLEICNTMGKRKKLMAVREGYDPTVISRQHTPRSPIDASSQTFAKLSVADTVLHI